MNTFHCGKGDHDSKFLSQLNKNNIAQKNCMLRERSTANIPDVIVHAGADTVL